MWKLFLLVIFLSADAQKLKVQSSVNIRERSEIYDLSDVGSYQDIPSYRLPNDTRPEFYLINLNFGDFHADEMGFTGSVLITIRIVESTNTITMHSSVLVDNTALVSAENDPISHSRDYDTEREFIIIKADEILIKDSIVRLTVNYQGTIGTSISGVYRGTYLHNENEIRC